MRFAHRVAACLGAAASMLLAGCDSRLFHIRSGDERQIDANWAALAPQGSLACGDGRFEVVRSLQLLAPDMAVALAAHDPLADRGEAFNSTDAVNTDLPMRRFAAAAVGARLAFAEIEHGGDGYHLDHWVFENDGTRWVGGPIGEGPGSPMPLPSLLAALCKPAGVAASAPTRAEEFSSSTLQGGRVLLFLSDGIRVATVRLAPPATTGSRPLVTSLSPGGDARDLSPDDVAALRTRLLDVRPSMENDWRRGSVDAALALLPLAPAAR